jgi:Uma2 family endonuclease
MGQAAPKAPMTAEEFLAWDEHETIKREFVRGEVFAMAGADEPHVTASMNVAMSLRQHLRGSACRVFMLDMKLRVAAADAYFYPDVFVTCSAADATSPKMKSEPLLVVEVQSASTAAYDRDDKFAAYRTLPTLQEYLLVDPDRRRCDLFRKGADGLWVLHPFERGTPVQLESVQFTLSAERLWEDLDPPQVGDATLA